MCGRHFCIWVLTEITKPSGFLGESWDSDEERALVWRPRMTAFCFVGLHFCILGK